MGHVAGMGNRRSAYRVLKWRPVDKRSFGRPWHTLEDNIKMDLQEVAIDVEAWTVLMWLRTGQVVGICECGNEPSGSIKCRTFLD